eukprot:2080612-Rhodomonas_salina.1
MSSIADCARVEEGRQGPDPGLLDLRSTPPTPSRACQDANHARRPDYDDDDDDDDDDHHHHHHHHSKQTRALYQDDGADAVDGRGADSAAIAPRQNPGPTWASTGGRATPADATR